MSKKLITTLKAFTLIISYFFCCANTSFAKIFDYELAQSKKCVQYFNYFERKHEIPKDLLHSISLQESGRRHKEKNINMPWPWTVNVEGKGFFFDTKKEAVSFVLSEIKEGKKSIDVGCMQINLKHHPDAFKNISEAFEPKFNIEYGAKFLKEKFEQLNDWDKAIAHYHSANPQFGVKYQQSVVNIAKGIDKNKSAMKGYASSEATSSKSLSNRGIRTFNNSSYSSRVLAANENIRLRKGKSNSESSLRRGSKSFRVASSPEGRSFFDRTKSNDRYRSNMMVRVPRLSSRSFN